jgi:serine phosphatase RsbU (regulator of sigma subunit)
MGRGLQAAAAMAELRSVIRAYVVDDPDPATVFRRVDAFCDAVDYGQLATVLYFLVEPGRGTVEIISAGHLPPLLVSAGQARLVDVPRGLPFGCGPDERIATTVRVPSGTALVAITDGLVERRGEDIDVGIKRLLDATRGPAMTTARALLSRLLNAGSMQRSRDDDDITILVLRHE